MQKTLTNAQVTQALALHANNIVVTAQQVQNLLQNASITFAQILYVVNVQLAAAHKTQQIQKVVSANVQLCSNINAHTSVYARAVRKSAASIQQHNAQSFAAAQQFAAAQSFFKHTDCYSIIAHKQHAHMLYLFAIYNSAKSVYVHNNAVVTAQHVAQYCTASAAKAMLQKDNIVHNKTHNFMHKVCVRTIALNNIVQIRARKQVLSV